MTRLRASTLVLGALMVVASACGTQPADSGSSPSASPTTPPATSSPTPSSTPTPTRTPTPKPTPTLTTGRVYWEDLEPGMCIDTRKLDSDYDYWVVPCKAKHDREVVKTTTLPGTNTWPGDRAVAKLADSTCRAAFKKYVGISYNKSDLQVDFITTVKEDWQDGFRTAVCLVFDPDHKTIKHSLKGSRT